MPQKRPGSFLEAAINNKNIMNKNCLENSLKEKNLVSDAIQEVEDRAVRDNKLNSLWRSEDKKKAQARGNLSAICLPKGNLPAHEPPSRE
jgi:uncharacterized protein YehS (DUF1456 family)